MPNQSCSHTNFETSFPNTYWVEIAAPSASTTYLRCIDVTSSKFSHAATCVVWVPPTCTVIQSEEQSLDHVTSLGVFSITPHTPRRWNLAWLSSGKSLPGAIPIGNRDRTRLGLLRQT